MKGKEQEALQKIDTENSGHVPVRLVGSRWMKDEKKDSAVTPPTRCASTRNAWRRSRKRQKGCSPFAGRGGIRS